MAGEEEDRHLDAAERALGTLGREAERPEDVPMREAWERRLAPLAEAVGPVEPPAALFDRVLERIDASATVVTLAAERRRARRWQSATAAIAAVAAAALLWIAYPFVAGQHAPRYVAVVYSQSDGRPAMVVEVDTGSGVATVVPLAGEPPAGGSFEMWRVPAGSSVPVSLGLLPQQPQLRQSVSAAPGDLFAISLEPQGGSPTGQPTEVLYTGEVVRAD